MTGSRRFLVTSATTRLGREVAAQLTRHGLVVRVRAPHEPEPSAMRERVGHVHVADLTRSHEVRDLMLGVAQELRIDTVVHLPTHDASTTTRKAGRLPEAEATRLLLAAAEQQSSVRGFVLRSSASVYRIDSDGPALLDEEQPLDFAPEASAATRAWLETDEVAAHRIGLTRLQIAVLRLADMPELEPPLRDYLSARFCPYPLGYDPMLNLLSIEDAARALALAALHTSRGVFNVPGADLLPISELIHRVGRVGVPVPGPLIAGVSALRRSTRELSADLHARLHYGVVVDGSAAQRAFEYEPQQRIVLTALHARAPAAH